MSTLVQPNNQVPLLVDPVTGIVQLPQGVEMIMPGDNINLTIELIAPIAMERTQRFAIREGGRTIGSGRITEILE